MNVMRTLTAFAIGLTLAAGFAPAMAQAGSGAPAAGDGPGCACGPRKDGPRDGMRGRMEDQLNLTPAQKASFQAIFARHKDSMAARRKASFAAREAFTEAVKKPETTPEALKALHRTLSDLRFDGMMERRTMRQELRAVLTPDQREQAARMEGRMEGMRMARSGGRGGWGEGGFPGGMKGWRRSEAPAAPAPAAPATPQ